MKTNKKSIANVKRFSIFKEFALSVRLIQLSMAKVICGSVWAKLTVLLLVFSANVAGVFGVFGVACCYCCSPHLLVCARHSTTLVVAPKTPKRNNEHRKKSNKNTQHQKNEPITIQVIVVVVLLFVCFRISDFLFCFVYCIIISCIRKGDYQCWITEENRNRAQNASAKRHKTETR